MRVEVGFLRIEYHYFAEMVAGLELIAGFVEGWELEALVAELGVLAKRRALGDFVTSGY